MKTAILKIEVPDNFEKGEYEKCPLSRPLAKSPYVVFVNGCRLTDVSCCKENCPLEIEDVETTHCYLGSPCEYQNKDIRIDEEIDQ